MYGLPVCLTRPKAAAAVARDVSFDTRDDATGAFEAFMYVHWFSGVCSAVPPSSVGVQWCVFGGNPVIGVRSNTPWQGRRDR